MSVTKTNLPIKKWSEADRPREKLIEKGKKNLSNAELMAILIGSGNKTESAVSLCKRILASVDNNLNTVGRLTLNQLTQFKGIGEAKAISIVAALELGRRQQKQEIPMLSTIKSSDDVFNFMQPLLGDLEHEEFWVLFINNSNKVIHKKMISSGGQTGTLIDNRLIFKKTLELSAVALILIHNHPSGNLKPSEADKNLTSSIQKAAETLSIKILDHIIITEKDYYSFADNGIL